MDNIERYILDSHILVVKRDFEADDPVPMHWHEYYEIEIFLSGKGKMFLNGEEYSFEKGSLFFLTPVDFHRIDFHEKTEALNISFDPACLEDTLMPEILMTMGSMAKLDDLENLLVMINRLKNEIENQKSFSKKYVSSVMNCILIDIYRKCGAGTKEISAPVQKAILYIHRKFRENITLNEVAEVAGLSVNYFSVKFREVVGENFKKYLIRQRLNYAIKLLEYTDLKVSEIAFYCGFNSQERFIRNFREIYSITPYSYRKKFKKDKRD